MQHRALKFLYLSILFSSLITHYPSLITPTQAQEPPAPTPAPSPEQAPPPIPLPEDPLQRGQVLLERGDLEGAESAFREVLQKAPKKPEPHYFLGVIHLQKGEGEKAIDEFQKVLAIIPDHLFSHHNIGLALLRLGKVPEAIQSFEKSLQIQLAFYPAYLELGLIYESQERVEEALDAFNAVIRYGGSAPQAQDAVKKVRDRLDQMGDTPEKARQALELFKRGQELYRNNQIKEAEADFQEILKLIPKNVAARYFLAQTSLEKGNIFGATRLLEQAIQIDPNAWQVFYLLGQIYDSQGRLNEATLAYLVVAQFAPEESIKQDVRSRLATLKDILEELRLREVLRKDIPLGQAREKFEQGIAALQQGSTADAINLLKEAANLDPTNPFYQYNLGIAYFTETRLIEATRALQKSIEMRKEYGPSHFFLSQIYVSSGDAARDGGDLVGATQEYTKALAEFDQTFVYGAEQWQLDEAAEKRKELASLVGKLQEAHGHTILGTALSDRADKEGALREYELASALVPQDPFSRISMGLIYEERKEVDKAVQIYEAAAQASPRNPTPYIYLGLLYEKESKWEEAIQAYQKAVERGPRLTDPVIRIGAVYLTQRRLDEARTQFMKAIELDPKLGDSYFYLGQLYEREGESKAAIQEYKKAQGLVPAGSEIAQFTRDRIAALNPFSGSWSHTFLSYDNNASNSQTNTQSSVSNSFNLGLNYTLLRRPRIHRLLPVSLVMPVEFSSGSTTLMYSNRLFNNESVSVSLQTNFLEDYFLSTGYRLTLNYNDQDGPTNTVHVGNISGNRRGKIPSRIDMSVSLANIDSLIRPQDDRVYYNMSAGLLQNLPMGSSGEANLNYRFSNRDYLNIDVLILSHLLSMDYSRSPYGSVNLSYNLTINRQSLRLDQSGKDDRFSFNYSNTFFGKIGANFGIDFTRSIFDIPRVFGSQSSAQILSTIEKNDTYSIRFGASYPLSNGLTLSMNYVRQFNLSNLDIPRAPDDEAERLLREQLEDQFRSLGTYQKHLVSVSVSKSF